MNEELRPDRGAPGGGQLELGSEPAPPVRIDRGPDNILYLTFDDPERPVNLFTRRVLETLDRLLDDLARATEASAVIARSFKRDAFLSGADLDELARLGSKREAFELVRLGQRVFAKVETLRLPVIAAIDGACLAGGAEFALACHYRLLSDRPSTAIGFPGLELGLMPAWGGTQRLPQVIGLRRALGLLLSGRVLDPEEARAKGLADEVYPAELFADQALAYTRRVVAEKRGPRRALPRLSGWERLIEHTRLGRAKVFDRAHEELYARTRGLYPAPPAILSAVRVGTELGNRAGYVVEARGASELLISAATRNMLALHFTTAGINKSRGVADSRAEARPVRDIGIVGAGTMGSGIAYAATRAEIPVRMRDIRHEANARALNQVRELYRPQVESDEVTPAEVERRVALIAPTLELKGFRRSDLVIEAVTEDLDVKLALLRELEPEVREDAIIASNTSSLSIAALGAALWRPSRFVGMHFFHPVARNRLVEVVRGEQTEDAAVATACALAKRLGKVPIVVADRPGFLVNRILLPYLHEACVLVEEGFAIDVVDRAMRNFGMPMGPLELLDEIGIDVAARAGENLRRATGITPSPLLGALVGQGRLGRKTGLGFYRTTGSVKRVDAEVLALVESLPAAPKEGAEAPEPEFTANVQERLVLPMINEAARALTDGAVEEPALVDLAMVLGAGFPSFRGGILRYADSLELAILVERMHALASDGRDRYLPAPLLKDLARQGRKFYPER